MSARLDCPHCGARAMSARDKMLWLEPSTAIPCARCGTRLSLPYWHWLAGGAPLYLLLILAFTGHIRSWPVLLLGGAAALAFFLLNKVFNVGLVPARRSAWTPYPWRSRSRGG